MPKEIELKLELDSAGADAIEASRLPARRATSVHMHTTYFDTPDLALRAAGLSLRLRDSGGSRIQTVKADGSPGVGLFDRDEWETPVSGASPIADPRTPLASVLGDRSGELAECFALAVERKTWRIASRKGEVEMAIDRCEVRAAERSEQFCELELELIRGEPVALFEQAKKLGALAPVRVGVLTKPERGYRLLGPLPVSSKAGKLTLDPASTLPDMLCAIAQHCIGQYRRNEAIFLVQHSPEAVHQARVALRRLRSAFGPFKGLLPEPGARQIQNRLRALAAKLGEVRDLDVLCASAEPGPLAQGLVAVRDEAFARLADTLAGEEPRRLMLDLLAWLLCGAWRQDAASAASAAIAPARFAGHALERAWRKVRKHSKHLAKLGPKRRHELRKQAKKLRYNVEFFASLYAKPVHIRRRKKFVRALAALLDQLGALNDRNVAKTQLAHLGLGHFPGSEEFLAQWDVPGLIDEAAQHRKKLVSIEPFWR